MRIRRQGRSRWAALLVSVALPFLAARAGAQEAEEESNEQEASTAFSLASLVLEEKTKDFPGPHAAIEFGVGVLALPDALICTSSDCDRGDLSLELDAWPLFRPSRYFAVGAGVTLALTPVQNPPQRETELARSSSRRYFMAEGIGRYYFAYSPTFEAWCGLSTGLVVVSDNFTTESDDSEIALVSTTGANIATEGLTLGLATGVAFRTSKTLKIGGLLRVANWFLPERPEVIAFLDRASLTGRVTMINLALNLSYSARE